MHVDVNTFEICSEHCHKKSITWSMLWHFKSTAIIPSVSFWSPVTLCQIVVLSLSHSPPHIPWTMSLCFCHSLSLLASEYVERLICASALSGKMYINSHRSPLCTHIYAHCIALLTTKNLHIFLHDISYWLWLRW